LAILLYWHALTLKYNFFLLFQAGRDGLLQVFQVDIDPPQTLARTLDTGQDFRYYYILSPLRTVYERNSSLYIIYCVFPPFFFVCRPEPSVVALFIFRRRRRRRRLKLSPTDRLDRTDQSSILFSLFFTFFLYRLSVWTLVTLHSIADATILLCLLLHLYYRCLVWDGLSVLLGTAAGQVLLFDLVEFRMVQPPLFVHQSNNEPVTCLLAVQSTPSSSSSMTIVSAGSDGRVCLWRPIK